ncbi:hypothetical protein NHQ30_009212 [Ciborinia camelliae]|nr:hypothetical protein NHQ30_009212 [Ciborinia camelliae]
MSLPEDHNEVSPLFDPQLVFEGWDDDLVSISINDPASQHLDSHTESSASIDNLRSHSTQKSMSRCRKIGTFGICVLVIGYITSLGFYGFLCFLWTGNENNPTWKRIVTTERIKTAVTISSGVIRTSISAQSAICTSMLAALMMEMVPFAATSSALLSIKRFAGGDPWTLLLARSRKPARSRILLFFIIITSLTSIVSQFLSTFLISDLAERQIFGDSKNFRLSTQFNITSPSLDIEADLMRLSPPSFPIFAEYTELPSQKSGIDDTGVSLRGLLPIGSSTFRENIHNYSGKGTLFNSRVICMRPSLRNLSVSMEKSGYGFIISGDFIPKSVVNLDGIINGTDNEFKIINDKVYPGVRSPMKNFDGCSSSFSCPLYLDKVVDNSANNMGGERLLAMCSVSSSSIVNGWPQISSPWIESHFSGPNETSIFLFLNVTKLTKIEHAITSDVHSKIENLSDNSTDGSIWSQLSLIGTTFQFSVASELSLSSCLATFDAIDTNITASSLTNNTEPTTFGSPDNSSSLAQIASQVTRQLGTDGSNSTLSQRGIMDLQKQESWLSVSPFEVCPSINLIGIQLTILRANSSMLLCRYCSNDSEDHASSLLMSIFQHSVISSGSLAQGLQAMLTTATITTYYTRLPLFEDPEDTHISIFEGHLLPASHTGFIFVSAILIIHLITTITITILFLFHTNFSMIGESWHTVAQLNSECMQETLAESSLMTDKEVEKRIKERGLDKESWRLKCGPKEDYRPKVVKVS